MLWVVEKKIFCVTTLYESKLKVVKTRYGRKLSINFQTGV